MSEQDKEQQTEEATPRKLEKLREEGKIVKSQDVTAAAVLVAAAAVMAAMGEQFARAPQEFTIRALRFTDVGTPAQALNAMVSVVTSTLLPFVAAAAVAATAVGLAQSRLLFSLKLLEFKPERLNPFPQLKNVLPGKQSLAEIGKQLLKVTAIGWVIYDVIVDSTAQLIVLPASEPMVGAAFVGQVATKVAIHGGLAFAIIAALDWWHAKKKYDDEAKMSKQDIKDEHKQENGSPEMKMRQRQIARQLVAQAGKGGQVKDASVLVCNPTHISVALRYDPEVDAAPMVLCMGTESKAFKMRDEARLHRVPIVENKPLARAIWADGQVGAPIPADVYEAAARVIAHVMQLRQGGAA